MTPAAEIGKIDRQVALHGERVELRRINGSPPNQVEFAVALRAFVRFGAPATLAGAVAQDSGTATFSPTALAASGWPGPAVLPAPAGDNRVPRKGDRIVVQGRERNIEHATPIYINDVLIRIDVDFKGG